jgi:hypothetical protein
MRYIAYSFLAVFLALGLGFSAGWSAQGETAQSVCRPKLSITPKIEFGKAGFFTWTCQGGEKSGSGYYVVFVRPSGTYVLLKVPERRTSFEFTPDTVGMWRWIVINTDPDGAKPDVESEPGNFEVLQAESNKN